MVHEQSTKTLDGIFSLLPDFPSVKIVKGLTLTCPVGGPPDGLHITEPFMSPMLWADIIACGVSSPRIGDGYVIGKRLHARLAIGCKRVVVLNNEDRMRAEGSGTGPRSSTDMELQ
jgi:hypothetical protein